MQQQQNTEIYSSTVNARNLLEVMILYYKINAFTVSFCVDNSPIKI